METSDFVDVPIKGKVKQSKRIPYWLWFSIAQSLGIKLHDNDQPVLSSILHIVTLVSGAGMMFTRSWYSGYDISSVHSATDILDGTVSILMVSLYCAVGIYAHRLAFRLFVHPKFLEKMRLHSKTIMKLNAAIVVLVVIAAFVIIQNLALASFAYGFQVTVNDNGTTHEQNPCQKIEIPLPICQSFFFFQLVFSFFFLLWNVLVAVALISVARTHTIDLRKFMRELAFDAQLQDKQFRKNFYNPNSNAFQDNLKEYLWMDNDEIANAFPSNSKSKPSRPDHEINQQQTIEAESSPTLANIEGIEHLEDELRPNTTFSENNVHLQLQDEPIRTIPVLKSSFKRLEEEEEEENSQALVPHLMTEQEIMHKYWKLVTSTRLTSMAFQRWMCCITLTILFWSSIRIVYWLSHTPSLYGILSFILPLLLLPLLASAYAEVNYEGIKVIQSILPTPDRVHMFQYLYGMPIQMTAYGQKINYSTMGTVLVAIGFAFASKILLQEMNLVLT